MIWSKFTKKSDFLHFNEIWLMFRPIPMYETNDIQLHFLVQLFWYLSQWSGLICYIFCNHLYSKDIHCAVEAWMESILLCLILPWTRMRVGAGLKMSVFAHAQGVKTVHAGVSKKTNFFLQIVLNAPLGFR